MSDDVNNMGDNENKWGDRVNPVKPKRSSASSPPAISAESGIIRVATTKPVTARAKTTRGDSKSRTKNRSKRPPVGAQLKLLVKLLELAGEESEKIRLSERRDKGTQVWVISQLNDDLEFTVRCQRSERAVAVPARKAGGGPRKKAGR